MYEFKFRSKKCILCFNRTQLISKKIKGSSSRGDKLYNFNLYECNVCGLIQKNTGKKYTRITNDIYKLNYTLPGGGGNVNMQNGIAKSREKELIDTLIEVGGLPLVGSFLDIGTGSGHLLKEFSKMLNGWKLSGHDVSSTNEQMVRNNGAAEFYSGSLEKITENFDLIVLNHVLEHVTEPNKVLKQVWNLLKPDGILVVIVPTYKVTFTDFYFMEHCSHFSQKTLNIAASLSGFKVLHNLEGRLGTVEIGFIARRNVSVSSGIDSQIAYTKAQIDYINNFHGDGKLGVFGLNGAGMYLAVIHKTKIDFIVDENPAKQDSTFNGIPIISLKNIASGATILVSYNNPKLSAKMRDKLELELCNDKIIFVCA
jgi:2-polyprenyl-3-methyl-5-hydroxy-6-metoxy-1,4-benzoquinol methylase